MAFASSRLNGAASGQTVWHIVTACPRLVNKGRYPTGVTSNMNNFNLVISIELQFLSVILATALKRLHPYNNFSATAI